jgi:hydroxymethylbilane synthase
MESYKKGTIRIGTRGSTLAIKQAEYIEKLINYIAPDFCLKRIIIKTQGDRDQKSSLSRIGGQGVFTKTIEEALLNGEIDVAVHSLKDLPSKIPPELELVAVPPRGPVEDVLVTLEGKKLDQLPPGARLATGSLRRRCQLLRLRPDLQIEDLRGNIPTRLRKLHNHSLEGIIMARAALVRLDIKKYPYQVFDPQTMIPAVGQGALGIQIRKNEASLKRILDKINHRPSFSCVTAERSLLRSLDSGCQFPLGAYARIEGDLMILTAFVGSQDGTTFICQTTKGKPEEASQLGEKLARELIAMGAKVILGN